MTITSPETTVVENAIQIKNKDVVGPSHGTTIDISTGVRHAMLFKPAGTFPATEDTTDFFQDV